jgi:predicted ATPase/DNA-binding winged helix-turn-helix (wHTH) protein
VLYTFADCELDTHLYILRRSDHHHLQLRPKVFHVLLYLLENRHRVVSKQELLTHVWPDHFISDATLENCIKEVRQVIGDSGRDQRLIHTLRGYGYRFAAAIASQTETSNDSKTRGTVLPEPLAVPDAVQMVPTREEAVGERKVVTILCCALAAAPALREDTRLDALHSLLRTLYPVIQGEVHRYGGTMQHVLIDRIMAVFGAPVAQEDHAKRAVLAALGIQQRVGQQQEVATTLPAGGLAVRMGLHTGPVAVGGIGDEAEAARTMIGDVARLAATLQERAGPGMILCSMVTARLVRDAARLEAAELAHEVGQTLPVETYKVLGHRLQQRPVVWHDERVLSQFVGRAREMAILQALLAQVVAGRGQVVGIVGEPGMGKSRLLYEFRQHLNDTSVTYVEGHCLSYGQATPYLPVLDTLRHLCGLTDSDPLETLVVKVHNALQSAGLTAATLAPYLLHLLGVQTGTDLLAMEPPTVRKPRTFEVLCQLSLHRSQQQPLVMAIENLHWIDPTSEEYLAALVEHLVGAPILLLLTYRPGYRPLWIDKSYATQLTLPQLTPSDSLTVVQSVLQTQALPDVLVQRVLTKAAGNPFFLEELTRAVLEHDTGAIPQTVPDTIQAVLTARIDRLLTEEKQLLQTAAVIGSEVRFALLQAVTGLSEHVLQQRLSALQTAEFLYERRRTRDRTYTFKHALTQEVAYNAVLLERQRVLHERAAQAIEARFPERLAEHYHALAYHYRRSGNTTRAVDYLQRAGQQAVERSTYVEAIGHLTAALDLLPALPETCERNQQELVVQMSLGTALRATKGYAAPEVERLYTRARELCELAGEPPQLFRVLWGLWLVYNARSEYQTTRALGEQLLSLAQRLQDPDLLLEAHHAQWSVLFHGGELAAARPHLEQGLRLYDPQRHRAHAALYSGHDPGVCCRMQAAPSLWLLGYPNQAMASMQAALALAQQLAHPHSLALALFWAAMLHHLRREAPLTQARAEATMTIATDHGLSELVARAAPLLGWALAQNDQGEEGRVQIHQGLAASRTIGAIRDRPYNLALLAEASAQEGQNTEGLEALAEALAALPKSGARWWEAELHRLRGELLLQHAGVPPGEVATCFHQALTVARRQQAKSLELRAAMSLSRLWQCQGKHVEAQQLLAEIYGWFTEGFDTTDLQEAKTLLEELSGSNWCA